jgi:hypothetical protein
MPGEFFFWYVPLRTVLVFSQPAGNLLRSLLVMDFGDEDRALLGKKLFSPAQDFVLTTLHVNLQQLWRAFTGCNKVVERDCWYIYDFTARQYGAVSIRLDTALRPRRRAPTKPDSIGSTARPYSGVHHSQAILQPVLRTVFS